MLCRAVERRTSVVECRIFSPGHFPLPDIPPNPNHKPNHNSNTNPNTNRTNANLNPTNPTPNSYPNRAE